MDGGADSVSLLEAPAELVAGDAELFQVELDNEEMAAVLVIDGRGETDFGDAAEPLARPRNLFRRAAMIAVDLGQPRPAAWTLVIR